MQLATSMQSGALDNIALKEYGLDGKTLMDNATTAFCEEFKKYFDKSKKVCIFSGRGKNGGDGFYIAKKLREDGYAITVVPCFSTEDKLNPLTKDALAEAVSFGLSISDIDDVKDFDICIDAILGTGVVGEISGTYHKAIEKINSQSWYVISVDCPSGVNCDNGRVSSSCVKAHETYTMAINKVGMNIYPGKEYSGKITVIDIGIPANCYSLLNLNISLVDNKMAKTLYPKRYENSHKGTYGKVAVFGGSEGMCGSIVMASEAVLSSGAGLSYACVNDDIFDIVSQKVTEVIVKHDKDYKEIYDEVTSLVIGPGYISNSKISHIMKLAQRSSKPIVVDAEGLNYINNKDRKCPIVATPHPKEFSKMIGLGVEEINQNRIYLSSKYAKENNVVLVLKGARTVIASPSGEVRINKSGTDAMATAGSGDVLSGLIAGFIAQGLSPFDAATLGAYIHGLAGEIGAKYLSVYSLKATDILNFIGKAFLYDE